MSVQEIIQSIRDSVAVGGNVKTIFGEPISAQGRTIVPVARVAFGFGAGGGNLARESATAKAHEGGGGGGGLVAMPVGVVEVSNNRTRWIPVSGGRRLAATFAAGIGFGLVMSLARRRK